MTPQIRSNAAAVAVFLLLGIGVAIVGRRRQEFGQPTHLIAFSIASFLAALAIVYANVAYQMGARSQDIPVLIPGYFAATSLVAAIYGFAIRLVRAVRR